MLMGPLLWKTLHRTTTTRQASEDPGCTLKQLHIEAARLAAYSQHDLTRWGHSNRDPPRRDRSRCRRCLA